MPVVVESYRRNRDVAIGERLANNSACRFLDFNGILALVLFQFVSTRLQLFLCLFALGCCRLVFLGRALSASLFLEGDIQYTDIAVKVSISARSQ